MHKYGFGNQRAGVFSRLQVSHPHITMFMRKIHAQNVPSSVFCQEELSDVIDLKNPEGTTTAERRQARLEAEASAFSPDHYLWVYQSKEHLIRTHSHGRLFLRSMLSAHCCLLLQSWFIWGWGDKRTVEVQAVVDKTEAFLGSRRRGWWVLPFKDCIKIISSIFISWSLDKIKCGCYSSLRGTEHLRTTINNRTMFRWQSG